MPHARFSHVAAAACLALVSSSQAAELSYLQSLLANTPQGGWVKASTMSFSSAWATPAEGGLPPGTYSNPGSIIAAWSSVAWDSQRAQLIVWGGGHANYMGNEVYLWNGTDGSWSRGSLPTRLTRYGTSSTYYTVDGLTPQSAHTYDNSLYLPVNDVFITFGGAAFNSGGRFVVAGPDGAPAPAGPWIWDPSKADPNKVGGATGSGYLPGTEGGAMWSNQRGNWIGNGPGPSQLDTNSAYRTENGKDVVYITSDSNASGFQTLYRYELGDVRNGEAGKFQQVGVSWYAPSYQSAATMDMANQLYIRTSVAAGSWGARWDGLGVWDLSKLPTDAGGNTTDCAFTFDQQSDRCLFDRYIQLQFADGSSFAVNHNHGLAYDEATGKLLLWDGSKQGTVWATQAEYLSNGQLDPVWTVVELSSTTTAQPGGNFPTGVLGKWQYVSELGAFVAVNEYNPATQDAEVWLYRPFTNAVPEPSTLALWLSGIGLIGFLARRRGLTTAVQG